LAAASALSTLVLVLASGSGADAPVANADASATAGVPGVLLGSSSLQRGHEYTRSGVARAFRFSARAGGSAAYARVFVASGSTAHKLYVGIYSEVGGLPGRLLGGAVMAKPVPGRWATARLSTAKLSRGKAYWLTVLPEGGGLHYLVRAHPSCRSQRTASLGLTKLPRPWQGEAIKAGCPISAYVLLSVAPTVTTLPTIAGSPAVGKVLTASTGSWSGAPTSYGYQWEDCNAQGASCLAIGGATAATHAVGLSDAGHTIRVVVSAANAHGSAAAASAATATVATPSNCIDNLAACGYPDPSSGNVGPGAACSALTPAGEMTITRAGTTVQNMNITGQVAIDASNVTLTHDCITANGGGASGTAAVVVGQGATNAQIDYSDVSGANSSSGSVEEAIRTNYANMTTTADHDYIYNCGECFHGAGTLTNDYVTANASIDPGGNEDHYEGIYYGGGGGPMVVEHDTILNPHAQTAAIFVSHDFGNVTVLTITNNILEGGDYAIYGGGSGSSGTVVGPVTVTGNRFATADFPKSGEYGPGYYFEEGVTIWSGNIWDGTRAAVPFPG
jgi:hypothetical protein